MSEAEQTLPEDFRVYSWALVGLVTTSCIGCGSIGRIEMLALWKDAGVCAALQVHVYLASQVGGQLHQESNCRCVVCETWHVCGCGCV